MACNPLLGGPTPALKKGRQARIAPGHREPPNGRSCINSEGRGRLRSRPRACARGPQADRGDDGPGQRLRRRDPGAKKIAADLPGPRHAQPGEGAEPGRLPGHPGPPLDQGRAPRTPTASTSCWTRPASGPHADIVNEVVLRTQMQAHYSDRQYRPLRPEPGQATPTSPRRSAATPT